MTFPGMVRISGMLVYKNPIGDHDLNLIQIFSTMNRYPVADLTSGSTSRPQDSSSLDFIL